MNESMQSQYTRVAILLHWLMAALLVALFGLGWYMVDLPKGSDERSWFFALHKSIGLTIALLACIRLCWRFTHSAPALPETVPLWQRRIAGLNHRLLYLMMVVQPVSGYISSSFSGYKTKFWGLALPHWGWKSPELNELFTNIHGISSLVLLFLIVLHLLGASVHLYRGEFSLLSRMLPIIKSDKNSSVAA